MKPRAGGDVAAALCSALSLQAGSGTLLCFPLVSPGPGCDSANTGCFSWTGE